MFFPCYSFYIRRIPSLRLVTPMYLIYISQDIGYINLGPEIKLETEVYEVSEQCKTNINNFHSLCCWTCSCYRTVRRPCETLLKNVLSSALGLEHKLWKKIKDRRVATTPVPCEFYKIQLSET